MVDDDSDGTARISGTHPPMMPILSMRKPLSHDENAIMRRTAYSSIYDHKYASHCCIIWFISILLLYPLRLYLLFTKMTDNIRRAMQDIDLGSNDAPCVLPQEVVRQAAEESRFILIGHPLNIVGSNLFFHLKRQWSRSYDVVHGLMLNECWFFSAGRL